METIELTKEEETRLSYLFYSGVPWEKLTIHEQNLFYIHVKNRSSNACK